MIVWKTNAPDHWPTLETEPLPVPKPSTVSDWAINTLMFITSLKTALDQAKCGCDISSVHKEFLFPEGILVVPVEVEDRGKRIPVFLYPDASLEHAAHYAGAAEYLKAKKQESPIYFAPSVLPESKPGACLEPFDLSMLTKIEEIESGRYATWWKSQEDPIFGKSTTFKILRKIFKGLDGVYSYILGAILREFKEFEDHKGRVALPDGRPSFNVRGPEREEFIITVSREKGFGFHFNIDKTSPMYRDSFLIVFYQFAKSVRAGVEKRGWPKDPPDEDYEGGPLGWWSMVERHGDMEKSEESSRVQLFGVVEVD